MPDIDHAKMTDEILDELKIEEMLGGTIPEVPDTNGIQRYVKECRQKDIAALATGIDGDLLDMLPYEAKQYYENTAKEIAEETDMSVAGVKSILHRSGQTVARRLLIVTLLDKVQDDVIAGLIAGGSEKINKKLQSLF